MYFIVGYGIITIILILLVFRKLIFRFHARIGILLLNDAELRGGGGLITLVLELYTFFGLPYRIVKHSHHDLHRYSQRSFYPFDTLLTLDFLLRDTNYSFFGEDNFKRLDTFYKKNFHKNPPNAWISIPYSFIEDVFPKWLSFPFLGVWINKKNLFRSLSDITGDNNLPPDQRKYALLGLTKYLGLVLIVPGVIWYILYKVYKFSTRRDIVFSTSNHNIQNGIFIGLCENNLKGRKSNRYMRSEQEYIFHMTHFTNEHIIGSGKIIIRKSIQSLENFPYVGKYNCTFDMVHSEHFTIIGGVKLAHSFDIRQSFQHEILFEFRIPKNASLQILRQSCIQNTNLVVQVDSPPFEYIPITNLSIQNDNWHFGSCDFANDFTLELGIRDDESPLRMIYRAILHDNIVQLSFQKPIKRGTGNFIFTFQNVVMPIQKIHYEKNETILIFELENSVPYYPSPERENVLKLIVKNIEDKNGGIHYNHDHRVIWFPWSEGFKN